MGLSVEDKKSLSRIEGKTGVNVYSLIKKEMARLGRGNRRQEKDKEKEKERQKQQCECKLE